MDFKFKNIYIEGNFPKDDKIKEILWDSGFFHHLKLKPKDVAEYQIGHEKQIFTQAKKEVDANFTKRIIERTGETIWGERRALKGLQTILIELMHNTNNHANLEEEGSERWWLSINHNKKEKKVIFAFVDYGVGIFESLKSKRSLFNYGFVKDFIKSNHEILRKILNKEIHRTATGEYFRGRGLPKIKKIDTRNQISRLHIITNDVYADVSNGKYNMLNNSFSGTFVLWEVNKKNINSEWIINDIP